MDSRMVHTFEAKAPIWSDHNNRDNWSNAGPIDYLTLLAKNSGDNEVLELALTPDGWRTIAALVIDKFGMAPNIRKAIDNIPPAFDRT